MFYAVWALVLILIFLYVLIDIYKTDKHLFAVTIVCIIVGLLLGFLVGLVL